MNFSLKNNYKKDTIFLGLIITVALLIRVFWAFFIAEEYWGDAYHNAWIAQEFKAHGEYYDYKNRHLVWLPLYRFCLIGYDYVLSFFGLQGNLVLVPFLFQCGYVFLVCIWGWKNLKDKYRLYGVSVLVLWPITIIFSGLNMSETLSLFLGTAVIIKLLGKSNTASLAIIVIGSAAVALTRHEGTAFFGLVGVLFLMTKQVKKGLSIFFGLLFGLLLLSIWNWNIQGEPFFWLTSKFTASGSGAKQIILKEGVLARGAESLAAIFFVFPFVPLILNYLRKDATLKIFYKIKEGRDNVLLILVCTIIFFGVFYLSSFFFFHGADPKYLLVVSFPCSLLTFLYFKDTKRKRTVSLSVIFFILIPIYISIFHFRSYNLSLERDMGVALKENFEINEDEKIWLDLPPVAIYAEFDPKRVISSEQINFYMNQSEGTIFNTLSEQKISYIVVANVDHSQVLSFFPEISSADSITVNNIKFVKSYTLEPPSWSGWKTDSSVTTNLIQFVKSQNRPISLWHIEY